MTWTVWAGSENRPGVWAHIVDETDCKESRQVHRDWHVLLRHQARAPWLVAVGHEAKVLLKSS